MKKNSIYAFIILSIAFITFATSFGVRFSFSIFFVAFLQEFGWSRALTAGAFSLGTIIVGCSGPLIGNLVDRCGPRRILIAGSLAISIGLISCSLITAPIYLYIFYGLLISIGISCIGMIPHIILLTSWFKKRINTVLSTAFSGVGISMFILGPFIQYLINHIGWRLSFVVLGLMLGIIIIPLNFFVIRDRPEQDVEPKKEDLPDKSKASEQGNEGQMEWTVTRALRTPQFWSLFLVFVFTPLGIFPVLIHHVAFLVDIGYDKILAASIFGILGLASAAGKLITGMVSDRIGREKGATLSYIFSIFGIIVLLSIKEGSHNWLLYTFALLFGLGFGARSSIAATMASEMFQGRHLALIYGLITVGTGIGGTIGPWFGGYIFDKTGSYTIAFLLSILALLIACSLFWIVSFKGLDRAEGKDE